MRILWHYPAEIEETQALGISDLLNDLRHDGAHVLLLTQQPAPALLASQSIYFPGVTLPRTLSIVSDRCFANELKAKYKTKLKKSGWSKENLAWADSFIESHLPKYLYLLRTLRPKLVILWNPNYLEGGELLFDACSHERIKTISAEWGLRRGSVILEEGTLWWNSEFLKNKPARTGSEYTFDIEKARSSAALRRQVLYPPDKRTIWKNKECGKYILVLDNMPSSEPIGKSQKGLFGRYRDINQVIKELRNQTDYQIIYKSHPNERGFRKLPDGIKEPNRDTHVLDLIQRSSAVFCFGTKLEYLCYLLKKPVILVGYGYFLGKGCAYELASEDLGVFVGEAINIGWTSNKEISFRNAITNYVEDIEINLAYLRQKKYRHKILSRVSHLFRHPKLPTSYVRHFKALDDDQIVKSIVNKSYFSFRKQNSLLLRGIAERERVAWKLNEQLRKQSDYLREALKDEFYAILREYSKPDFHTIENRDIWIWGAGTVGESVLLCLKGRAMICDGFVETKPIKKLKHGLQVLSAADFFSKDRSTSTMIIASQFFHDILYLIRSMKWSVGRLAVVPSCLNLEEPK